MTSVSFRFPFLLAATMLFGLLAGCKDNPGGNGSGQPIGDAPGMLSLGASYVYQSIVIFRDSTKDIVRDSTVEIDTGFVVVGSVNDKIGTLTGLVRVDSWSRKFPHAVNTWYRANADSLIEVGYRNPNGTMFMPKTAASGRDVPAAYRAWTLDPRFLTWARLSTTSDTTARTDPRIVYIYPLRYGLEWKSLSDPFLQFRKVGGNAPVMVQGRRFECTIIRTTSPIYGPDFEWLDYVANEGLVLRTIQAKMTITSESSPDSAGIRIFSERIELMSTTK